MVMDSETGEILDQLEEGQRLVKLEEGDRIVKKNSREFLKDTIAFETKESYTKTFDRPIDELADEEDLYTADLRIILKCMAHISYASGAIKYANNGKFITPNDIERETKLSKRTVLRSIEKLVDKKIFHKGRTGKEFQLYANPFLFVRGVRINRTLYDMFSSSKWAKKHKNEVQVTKS